MCAINKFLQIFGKILPSTLYLKFSVCITFPFLSICSQFPFSNEQVRILLYRECDWRGRRLLFDSTAVQKDNVSASGPNNLHTTPNCKKYSNYIDTIDGVSYRYTRPDEDFNGIGDMVFGSVSMSMRATTLKVCMTFLYSF